MATIPAHDTRFRIASPSIRADEPPAWRLIGFAALGVPLYAAGLPLVMLVPQLYATQYGLSLATIGLIFLVGRFWDVASDPLVGVLSDRTRTRFGRRKPWIAVGGLLFGIGAALLYFPPFVTPISFAATLFLFYAGCSMMEVPFLAWGGEISGEYHGRTRAITYQTTAQAIGLLLVLILPTLLEQTRPADVALKLHVVGGFIVLALVPALALTLTSFRERPLPANAPRSESLVRTASLIVRDRLLVRVLASDVAVAAGQSIRAGLIVFFAVSYMGLPAWASGLYLFQFVFGVFAGPIWLQIGRRLGKRGTAIAGELVQVAINLGLLFVVPGGIGLLLALTVAQGLAQGSGNLMLRAMVADVADHHELETGHNRTGLFFSVFALATKAGPAIGIGIALPFVAWMGFSPKGTNTPEALETLKLVFALGPALAHLLSAAILWRFPLDAQRHAAIRRALDARAAGQLPL